MSSLSISVYCLSSSERIPVLFSGTMQCLQFLFSRPKLAIKLAIYSPDIPEGSSDLYINYPQVLELTLSQSHLNGENAAQFSAAVAIHTVPISRSTWYPLLLGEQRLCGFKALPNAFTHDQRCGNRAPKP